MKTIITIVITICALTVSAQENYYKSAKTFNENGYTYQCDVQEDSDFITLYNKSNRLTYVEKIYRNTGERVSMQTNKVEFEEDNWTRPKCFSIVNNAFSDIEKQKVKDSKFAIVMYIDPNSGKVLEVKFRFACFQPYATIPVSVYRKIELELKKNIWFTPTEYGKRLNYIYIGWKQQPE